MHAQLEILLKSNVDSTVLSYDLRRHFGKSMLDSASEAAFLGSHLPQAVGVVGFPDGAVMVFLHIAADELMVRVQGKSIPDLKERCGKILRQLERLKSVAVARASAMILVAIGGAEIMMLAGEQTTRLSVFWQSLSEKTVAKVIPSAVVTGPALYHFAPSSPPVASAVIAMAAALVGVLAEALIALLGNKSWKWKESI